MNYGRWKYNQKKHQKKHHELQLKEVRLRPKTDTNDRNIKIKRAENFLGHGHKVQFTMVFRGREQSHREIGYEIFKSILDEFGERVKVERAPSMEGRRMVMIVSPNKGAFSEEKENGLIEPGAEGKPKPEPEEKPDSPPAQPPAATTSPANADTDNDTEAEPSPAETH
jgi:translation initiation factor IF-3